MSEAVGFNDPKVELSNFPKYQGRKGNTDRVAFVCMTLQRARVHYHNNQSFRCLSTDDQLSVCCKHLGEAPQRFGLILFHYKTDDAGDLQDEKKLSGTMKFWVISESRYSELSAIAKKYPLLDGGATERQVDLNLTCTEEKFQKMTIMPCPEAHWKKSATWYEKLSVQAQKAVERLKKTMGRTLTEDEVCDLLNVAQPVGAGVTMTSNADVDIEDILDIEE
jgi:hypothetical protein